MTLASLQLSLAARSSPGTPEVSEYCAAEFGVLQGVSSTTGRLIIGDALDLRHRLPELWARVCAGGVRAWQARKVAQATRSLPYEACRDLDAAITGYLGMMAWARFQKILDAVIIDADPDEAAARALRAELSGTCGPPTPTTG